MLLHYFSKIFYQYVLCMSPGERKTATNSQHLLEKRASCDPALSSGAATVEEARLGPS
jgi:hypothetical protein